MAEDPINEPGAIHPRQSQRTARKTRSALPIKAPATVAALGIVFGDIGTSPLYVMSQLTKSAGGVTPEVILGGLSLLFWSLTLVVTIKYVLLLLRTDHDGEGGIFALITLHDLHRATDRGRRMLFWVGLLGTAALFADGIITPAISVLSALEGIQVSYAGLDHWVLPLAAIILLMVFVLQAAGTDRIASLTGPIMTLWFVVLAVLGILIQLLKSRFPYRLSIVTETTPRVNPEPF